MSVVNSRSPSGRSVLHRWMLPLLILAVFWAWLISNQINAINNDSVQYYIGATNLWTSGNPYAASAIDLGISPTAWRFCYPPMLAYLWLPLSCVDLATASRVWFFVNLLLTVVLAWQLVCILQINARLAATVAVFAALLIYPPQSIGMVLGQSHVLLAVVLIGSYLAVRANYQVAAGLLLALAISLKLFPALVVLAYLAAGHRRAAWTAVVTCICWCVLTFRQHGEYVDQFVLQPFYPYAAAFNVSMMGLTKRLFAPSKYAVPVVDAPLIGLTVFLVSALAIVAILIYVARQRRESALIAATYPAMLLLTPVAGLYHCNLVPAAIAIICRDVNSSNRARVLWQGLFAALLLTGLPPEFGVPRNPEGWRRSWHEWIHEGWGALLMAPQTYGLILLLLLIGLYLCNEKLEN
ncbi:MAG: glycosyltransferase 87 family protein [Planctomycetota bacterium]|nr:glycosyltransferase 87 family protein [Planctomycetota bacterium]